MHGVRLKYGGLHDEQPLRELAEQVCRLRDAGCETFAYFNNDAEAYAFENAVRLRLLLGELMRRDYA